jgi:Low molecular weight phosphotyrosine protein phosphatase
MFGEPLFFASRHSRAGSAEILAEFIATYGLLSVIWGSPHPPRLRTPPSRWPEPHPTLSRAFVRRTLPALSWRSSPGPWRQRCFFAGWRHPFPGTHPTCCLHTRQAGAPMCVRKRILVLCTGNSARSQMAEGLLRHDAGRHFEVFSAGTKPSPSRGHPGDAGVGHRYFRPALQEHRRVRGAIVRLRSDCL